MPIFAYDGIRKTDGKPVKGLKDGESERAIRAALKREGILITALKEKSKNESAQGVDFKRFVNRVKRFDIALSTRQLATMTGAGISLVESLTAVIDQTDKAELKSALTDVRDEVNQGTSLSDAFSKHPRLFNHLFCNMVHAGEQSGTLELVLARLADFIEAQEKLKSKITGAMVYPMVIVVMSVGLIGVLITFVVPKLTSMYEGFGQELPWYTDLMIAISDFAQGYWWLVIILGVGAIYGFKRWKSSEEGMWKWHSFVMRSPIFGSLVIMVAISRFAQTLATLLSSGVPLLTAMDITKGVLGNVVLEKTVVEANASIREGESIAEPLKASGHFPPIVTHMIAIGEKSGQLEAMLENVARAYDTQVDAKVNAMTAIIEPLLIVTMGVIVLGIVLATMMPLVQMGQFIQ